MPHQIQSTLPSDNVYTNHAAEKGQELVKLDRVLIKGGTNGVVTEVSDEEMTLLQQNEVFNLHRKNGFITVRVPEVAASDVESREESAPQAPQDSDALNDGTGESTAEQAVPDADLGIGVAAISKAETKDTKKTGKK